MEADFPPEMQETFTNLENQFNRWGFSSDSRADWCKGMDVPLMTDKPDAELLYFVGCSGSFDDRGKKIAQAMARVLQKAGVNFAILGPEEVCNGDMARRAGNEYIAQTLMMQNVEVLNQYKPKKILTGCPHCYNIIKNEYPQFGASYEVVHHTDLLLGLFQQGRLKASKGHPAELSYHDSCYLGRWNGIYQAPRDLLASINGGAKPIEMRWRQNVYGGNHRQTHQRSACRRNNCHRSENCGGGVSVLYNHAARWHLGKGIRCAG
jgi:Fe-S oxidoreductase